LNLGNLESCTLGVTLSLSFHFQKGKKRKVKTFLS
jgi:hypothetical protein